MKVIGITGGIGSGKSSVVSMLRTLGWIVYSSDETAKLLMDTDPTLQDELLPAFGTDVLSDGRIERAVLAARVFGTGEQQKHDLATLNRLVHPRVIQHHLELLEQHDEEGTELVAIESALLFEVGLEDGFDYVILVDAEPEIRIQRVMDRSGLTREHIEARMREQMSPEEKRGLADFVIENNGTVEQLQRATEAIASIVALMPELDVS
ncbi:dephospho-CoA kinase [soil metagenome]